MAREFIEETDSLESTTLGVFRSAATMAGGRRFSFGSLVVVGDKRGRVGIGYAKANEVPPAIEKAQKDAKKNLQTITLQGGTIPHMVTGRYSASMVRILPASPGTGIVAGATVRAVLEAAGVTDCMTKSYGSTNAKNLAKATLDGLKQLRTKEAYASLRGVTITTTEVDERLERGAAFLPPPSTGTPIAKLGAKAPEDERGRGRGGRGGGRGGRGGRRDEAQPTQAEAPAAESTGPSSEA
jgi:small subunit ribosomal protein S5